MKRTLKTQNQKKTTHLKITLSNKSPKKIQRWQKSLWKDAPHHVTRKCKLKQQRDATAYLLKWPVSGKLTTPNGVEDVTQKNTHTLLVGMQNGAATLEEFDSSLKCYPVITQQFSTLRFILKRNEIYVLTQKHTHKCLSSLIAKKWKK